MSSSSAVCRQVENFLHAARATRDLEIEALERGDLSEAVRHASRRQFCTRHLSWLLSGPRGAEARAHLRQLEKRS